MIAEYEPHADIACGSKNLKKFNIFFCSLLDTGRCRYD